MIDTVCFPEGIVYTIPLKHSLVDEEHGEYYREWSAWRNRIRSCVYVIDLDLIRSTVF
jgi:hypothetical protein